MSNYQSRLPGSIAYAWLAGLRMLNEFQAVIGIFPGSFPYQLLILHIHAKVVCESDRVTVTLAQFACHGSEMRLSLFCCCYLFLALYCAAHSINADDQNRGKCTNHSSFSDDRGMFIGCMNTYPRLMHESTYNVM